MRQIKFKGLRTDGKGWVYGDLIQTERDFEKVVEILHWQTEDNSNRVIPESVGQFTGLHDKNGTEIYEGDVLQYNHGSNESYVVEYVIKGFNQSFGHGLVGVRTICGFDFDPYHNVPERCEVIGNIHTQDGGQEG